MVSSFRSPSIHSSTHFTVSDIVISLFKEEKAIFRKQRQAYKTAKTEHRFRIACRNALSDGRVTVEEKYGIKLRHGALYPLLNNLERKGFLRSKKETKRGRVRKIYEITSKGIQLVDAFDEFMREQI